MVFNLQILAIMGFLGFANVYAMRVNLSVAIVAMVNNTAIASNTSIVDNSSCPVGANSTEGPPPDGPFAWGAKEQGWILGAFFFGYVITQLPGGRLAEKYGGKRLYGGGILITSIFTLLTPLAATISLPLFVIVRVIEGFGEGVTFPVMHALLAQVLHCSAFKHFMQFFSSVDSAEREVKDGRNSVQWGSSRNSHISPHIWLSLRGFWLALRLLCLWTPWSGLVGGLVLPGV